MIWDGHTHTEYCPHGDAQPAEEKIRKAIELGYTDLSITEHAPLPKSLLADLSPIYADIEDAAMDISRIGSYFKQMHELKGKYKNEIRVHVGVELDFLEDYISFTQDFLKEYAALIDDAILSVHFMKGPGGMRMVDYSPEDQLHLIEYYGSYEGAEEAYYQTLIQSVQADLGPHKPKRIGHPTVFRKFQLFDYSEDFKPKSAIRLPGDLVQALLEEKMGIDYNGSGAVKKLSGVSYPPPEEAQRLQLLGIPLIPGSDAHRTEEFGNAPRSFA